MAESKREGILNTGLISNENITNIDCAVCLQAFVHPAKLPCGHIFCYLCIKGIINQGRRCAMCRQEIPVDYLDKPVLLKPMDTNALTQGFEDGHLWFYEGHNGWWQYDERTSLELESAYQKGERCCDLLIAGFIYTADFDGMLQYRKNDPSRRRRIKRDLATTTKKGIAGLKLTEKFTSSLFNNTDLVSSDLIQSLPVSNSSEFNNLNNIVMHSSGSNNFEERAITELTQNCQTNSRCSLFLTRPEDNSDSNEPSDIVSSESYGAPGQSNVVQGTLDWTIEHIESLNLELLNDYETVFRDVSNYDQLQHNLNYRRQQRGPRNSITRFSNVSNSGRVALENNFDSRSITSETSHLNIDENNSFSDSSLIISEGNDSSDFDVDVSESESLALQSILLDSPPPLPPPRTRSMSRIMRSLLQHSPTSQSNIFLTKLISKK